LAIVCLFLEKSGSIVTSIDTILLSKDNATTMPTKLAKESELV